MSLDFYLEGEEIEEECECSHCNNKHTHRITPLRFHRNITHNLVEMADKSGIYKCLWRPDENGYNIAEDIIEPLIDGLKYMRVNRQDLEKMNPENGWGSYEGLLRFTEDTLSACREFPKAKIRVWR